MSSLTIVLSVVDFTCNIIIKNKHFIPQNKMCDCCEIMNSVRNSRTYNLIGIQYLCQCQMPMLMKIIIEDAQFTFACDFDKPIPDEDETLNTFPEVDEAIDAFLRLLENIYSAEKIADCLASGELSALDYSEKGIKAREMLRK